MTLCLVQLDGCQDFDEARNLIDMAEELFGEEYRLVYSIRSSETLWRALCHACSSYNFIYLGEQKRTDEEYFLFYAFYGLDPKLIYDASRDIQMDLERRCDWALCRQVKIEHDRCESLKAMDRESSAQLKYVLSLLDYFSARATKICTYLQERIRNWQELASAESALIRGLVDSTLFRFSSESNLRSGDINKYDRLLELYRSIGRRAGINSTLVDERKELLIALASKNFAHSVNLVSKFLLVHSAYTYSLSQFYCETESNLAGLFLFRSFECLILSYALENGLIKCKSDRDGISFYLGSGLGEKISGVGPVWYLVKRSNTFDKSLIDSLGALITSRNKSFLGHGFFHFSSILVAEGQKRVYELISLLLEDGSKDYWLKYKKCSRAVDLKDFGWSGFTDFSLR